MIKENRRVKQTKNKQKTNKEEIQKDVLVKMSLTWKN